MKNANIEPELKSLVSKVAIEIENDSKEIEILKKQIEKNDALLRAVRSSLSAINPEAKTSEYGAKKDIIRDAIRRISTPQFTQDGVEGEIKRVLPTLDLNRNRVRSALWTMAHKGEIKLIRRGTNKEPALYEKNEGIVKTKRLTEDHKEQTLRNDPQGITAALLESSVREKSGRIDNLAKRLNTEPKTIESLLEPASKVYVGSAGWLRLRE